VPTLKTAHCSLFVPHNSKELFPAKSNYIKTYPKQSYITHELYNTKDNELLFKGKSFVVINCVM
jgi:hypothetical protein